jgi:hypothetical protein
MPLMIPKAEPPRVVPMAPQPAPAAAPQPVHVTVDNSYLVHMVEKQQEQLNQLATQMNSTILELVGAVQRLEPGSGFTVDVTAREFNGRIKTLKITKE